MLSKLPRNLTRLNEKVENINWSSDNTLVTVKTNKNTYQAKQVISTASLGYLKNNYQTLFQPSLPSDKVKAINKLGFGSLDKMFIVYDQPLFEDPDEIEGLKIVWLDNINFSLEKTKAKWNIKVKTNRRKA